ncbi:related to HOS4 - subunit of the Set3 complex [Ustilago trichophora]|uniref:Related to HOS4 - subunit of the Set3 complex n=1 Tax=Ustilago trichophora TaxID=86804 RepID=A0A5C3EC38_9BASI|nr:related to HOS4 - subunit of the Set3 complex [Ustilago trichophora]
MMTPTLQSTTPIALPRGAKQPHLNRPPQHKEPEQPVPSCVPGPSSLSRTTLSQRFRRAIQQADLSSAQRIAARAFELQFLPRTTYQEAFNESSNLTSPVPSKAALRAAEAQRPSSAHPFDVRNVEPVSERIGLAKHHHHRKYTLAIHDEPLTDTSSTADPSLVIAIKSNADVELVRWLIEMGHEQKRPSVDADGNTVLHLATLYDRSDIIYAYSTYTNSHVAATLSDLIDADTLHDRRTALHLACIRGFDDVARQLLDLGADVDLQDRAGNTALHFASAWGHISLVQLLIERGCSLAVKNVEGSTPSDYAYSHSVKEALETMGRVRYESRKKTRRVPVATVMPAAIRPPATAAAAAAAVAANAVSPQLDESSSSDRQARTRPFPSFLSRNGSNSGASRSSNTTPIRTTFADMSGADQTAEVIDDWDPEKTFAQPGQDLFPGNRGAFSSPPVQRVASPANFSTPARPSIDLYSEVLNHSPRAPGGFAPPPQHPHRAVSPQPRALAQSPPSVQPSGPMRSPDEAMMQWQAAKGLFPQSASDAEIRRQLSPNLGPIRRTPSPGNVGPASSADKVRMQDAAAMSLFRSTTPQPGVPGRIDTPPLNIGGRESPFMSGATKGKSGNANANARANAGGVKSPPPQTETTRAARSVAGESTGSSGEGPPLLAPIATLPRGARTERQGESEDMSNEEVAERQGRLMHNQIDTAGPYRDGSSPSTPRPDDRETFG